MTCMNLAGLNLSVSFMVFALDFVYFFAREIAYILGECRNKHPEIIFTRVRTEHGKQGLWQSSPVVCET